MEPSQTAGSSLPYSRRSFIEVSSAAVAGLALAPSVLGAETPEKIALEGGQKAVTVSMPKPKRWGDLELAQLSEAVKQPSLYYWRNKQTGLFTERFRKI